MNLDAILEAYRRDARMDYAARWLVQAPVSPLFVANCLGAQWSFVLAAWQQRWNRPQLVLAADKEKAAHLQNELAKLLDSERALFFPDSFKRPLNFDRLNRTAVLQRTETISQLVSRPNLNQIVISYPEALFEKVVSPEILANQVIELSVGHQLDLNFMLEILSDYGFEAVDFVYEPGQYALRGGIVDVYSYGNELPYRIELFDNEVESIRAFDPDTQLSKQKMQVVRIVPNVNTRFEAKDKVALPSILARNTIVWVEDAKQLLERVELCFEQARQYQQQLLEREQNEGLRPEELDLLAEAAFLYPAELWESLGQLALVQIQNHQPQPQSKQTWNLDYGGIRQPYFNKNFEMLMEDWRQRHAQGYTLHLFAESPKQAQRFEQIFEDLNFKLPWQALHLGLHQGFLDPKLQLACYTDHQIFERYHAYKLRQGFDKDQALRVRMLQELQPGDYVTHIDHGVGRYGGLQKVEIGGKIQEAVRLIYRDNDVLYVGIQSLHKIAKYTGQDGKPPAMHKLGSNAWANIKQKTKKKIKELAFDLIKLYAQRRQAQGISFPPDGYLQAEMESSFMYEDTLDQAKACEDVKLDMMKPYPMDRLVCGDVGFGKTEVALRAAFKAVTGGTQVAVLVPTTILALQHANTFRERFAPFNLKVEYLNRFKTSKEKQLILADLAQGKIDVLIGTHALLGKQVKFKKLGLLVIDEEQKFGVGDKEKLRDLKVNVDTLTLTATPIPRTLQFSLLGARDLSIINTPPPNRQPIHTEARPFNGDFIREVLLREVARSGQAFFIHNRVQSLGEMCGILQELCPEIDFGIAHGQMEARELETTLTKFIKGHYDVLVCTNIIETGLDIANANTIIINDAQNFGLSDLHQLRGRVGRSNKKAYCYLLCPPIALLNSDSRKRLQTIEEFSELGSGFQIAMKDLDIRGAGNLLGGEQSGFIVNMGYETYQKILAEAIAELKQGDYKELFQEELENQKDFVNEVNIEAEEEMLLPDSYVSNIQERLALYQKMDKLQTPAELQTFREGLQDRFGKIPRPTENLFLALKIRPLARQLGFERLIINQQGFKGYFLGQAQSPFFESASFGLILDYIQQKGPKRMSLKQSNKHLILRCEQVRSLSQTLDWFQTIQDYLQKNLSAKT